MLVLDWSGNMIAMSKAVDFLNMLGVVKAVPQARPKTTWLACIFLKSAWDYWLDLFKVVAELVNECLENSVVCCTLKRWSYSKRAWDTALTFKRASRSLAKTGSLVPPKTMKNHSVFDVFRRWRGKLGVPTCKNYGVFEVFGGLRVKKPCVLMIL